MSESCVSCSFLLFFMKYSVITILLSLIESRASFQMMSIAIVHEDMHSSVYKKENNNHHFYLGRVRIQTIRKNALISIGIHKNIDGL